MPKLVAPTAVESVAMPTIQTVEVRMPATMTGMARGSSTWRSCWDGDMPTPRAASLSAGSTPAMPVTVLRRTGRTPYSVSAMMAALALPPIIDIARHTTSFTGGLNNLLVTQSGGDLYRMNREILNGMGFPPSQTEPFLDNEDASPRHKTFIVAAMKDLEGVEGLDILIARGRALRSEDDALRLQRTVELARGHHSHVAPLRRIVDVGGEIVLVTTRGQVVATLPADRLLWTAYAEQLATSLAKQKDAEPEVDEKHLWITGVFSDEARKQLRDRDIVLHDQASDSLEPPSP